MECRIETIHVIIVIVSYLIFVKGLYFSLLLTLCDVIKLYLSKFLDKIIFHIIKQFLAHHPETNC